MSSDEVFRIRIIDGDDISYEEYSDEDAYHARLRELRCHLKEQTYMRVKKNGDDVSAIADMRQERKV